ncbi:hypothetical protein CLOM_g8218 [Closterium sp. NIES-68]|nr:hypothetical protein CLOM_g8218 [Closterium sp. NIES-68]GJP66128.1 hypothetical protein CLOP_g23040 [Closterium sp. NIES-67]
MAVAELALTTRLSATSPCDSLSSVASFAPTRWVAAPSASRQPQTSRATRLVVSAETESKGLTREGVLQGGRWLSSNTRHVRIYVGYIDPQTMEMDQTQADKLSLLLDPDNEFLWSEETEKKVYDKFTELVEGYAGAEMSEYTLRLIGSDLEHFIRNMLLAGEISYNLDCRVLNFSMGKPRMPDPAAK